ENTDITGVSIDDPDAGTGTIAATFSIPSDRGELSAVGVVGIALTIDAGHTVILEGTLAAINSYLAAGNLQFQNAPYDVSDVPLTVTVDDRGNIGTGGAKTASEEITLTILPKVPEVLRVYSTTPDGL